MNEGPIPYGMHWLDDDDIQHVIDVLRSQRLTQGPLVERFEARVAEYCGAGYGVAFSSGTAALHGAVFAAGIEAGDQVITSPLTFAGTANAIIYQGGDPVFADIDEGTGNLDPVRAKAAVTPRTRAILPVHYAGHPCDLGDFRSLCDEHGLLLIDDACHALGATYQEHRIGGCGETDMSVFSFHPVKHVTTGEGGMVLTDDPVLRERLALFRTHGITKDPNRLTREEGPWYYEMQALGFNYRLSDIHCALGLSQMDKLDRFLARRREIAERYRQALADEPAVKLTEIDPATEHAYHIFVIRLVTEQLRADRRTIFEALQTAGLLVQVHYIPVHLQPYYRARFGHEEGDFPLAERFYRQAVTIPLFPKMTDDEVKRVLETVQTVLDDFRI